VLYKIDKNGFVVNEASFKKIQPYYKKILEEINQLYIEKLGSSLLSTYIRGSVSTGKAKPYVSDIDSVAITKNKIPNRSLLWTIKVSRSLEEKYPKAELFELTIVSLQELLKSEKYNNLRIYLKTQSVCLFGKDILPLLPKVRPNEKLAIKMYGK